MKSKSPTYYRFRRRSWRDETWSRIIRFGPNTFIVAMYLLSSPRGNMAGIFECPIRLVHRDTNLNESDVKQALKNLCEISFIKYDDKTDFVWVISAAVKELGDNPSAQQVIGVLNILDRLENDELAPFVGELRSTILDNSVYLEKTQEKKKWDAKKRELKRAVVQLEPNKKLVGAYKANQDPRHRASNSWFKP